MTDAQREAREKRVRDADGCDICGGIPCLVHEVARGIHRQAALLANFATLVLCDECHRKVHQGMPVAVQLAYIMLRRDSEFDMPKFYKLTGRVWPSLEDINHAHAAILAGINARVKK